MSTIGQTDACVQLRGLGWDGYLRLRALPESRNVRMTFDRGVLELMSPSKLHERIAELLGRLVLIWTEERNLPVQSCGSTTFQRDDLQQALEPDKCYYIQHEIEVRNRDELDLSEDPPPDLIIEVDITSPSRDRLPIYASLGVPEIWLWRKESLTVWVLEDNGVHDLRTESTALPDFPLDQAQRLLRSRAARDETALVKEFRAAIRET